MSKKPGRKLDGEHGIWLLAPRKFALEVNVRGHGRKREVFEGTLHEARNKLNELKLAVKTKLEENCSLKLQTFLDVLTYYWDKQFQYTARATKCKKQFETLKTELGGIVVDKITPRLFEDWLLKKGKEKTSRDKVPSSETLNTYITMAKGAFNFGVKEDLIQKNPITSVERKGFFEIQTKVISLDELIALRDKLPEYLRPWLEFIYKLPTRRGEVLALRNPEDINLTEKVLYIRAKDNKSKIARSLVIPDSMMSYFENIPKESKWVFYRPEILEDKTIKYHPLLGQSVLQSVQRAANDLDIKGITVHGFRRTASVNMIRAGVDMKTIMEAGGWKSLDILVERYLPLGVQEVRNAVAKVDVPLEKLKLTA